MSPPTVTLDDNGNTLNSNTYNINIINTLDQDLSTNFKQYKDLFTSYSFFLDLYEKYNEDNNTYKEKTTNDTSSVLVNERKTYYEEEGIESLNYYYLWLIGIYVITIIVYIISLFIFPSDWNLIKKIGILIALIILPFTSSYILSFIVSMIYKLYGILPKNVNLTL